jgi:hypothetical protein
MKKLIKYLLALAVITATQFAAVAQETTAAPVAAAEAAAAAPTPHPNAELVEKMGAAAGPSKATCGWGMDTVWVLVCGMLVFWMNAGFALVESGLCRQKNCVNILAKNFVVFAASTISFYVIGWGLMFGDGIRGSERVDYSSSPARITRQRWAPVTKP